MTVRLCLKKERRGRRRGREGEGGRKERKFKRLKSEMNVEVSTHPGLLIAAHLTQYSMSCYQEKNNSA